LSRRPDHVSGVYHGFLAQEVEEKIPSTVFEHDTKHFSEEPVQDSAVRELSSYKTLSLENMLPELWSATQRLAERLEAASIKRDALRERLAYLESRQRQPQ